VQRFEEIDADLRVDIALLLAKDIGEIIGESVESVRVDFVTMPHWV
jgi:hypothetical protein